MTRWILGNALLSAGLLWVAASWVLWESSFFGDLSIGGGFTVVVAYAVIVTGVSFLGAELSATRPLVRNGVQVAPAEPLQLSRPKVWIPAVISAMALVAGIAAFIFSRGVADG